MIKLKEVKPPFKIMKKRKFYITTTLPYVNAEPHIGFALEIVQADVIARYYRQQGYEVFFNTGVDEHGLKVFRKIQEENLEPQVYCDIYAKRYEGLKQALNLSYNSFIRTTSSHHIKAAQEFWHRCDKNGDIYKKDYKIKYCVGCELEKTESELVDGRCPVHPDQELEIIKEENYFFRYSRYQNKLLELYQKNPQFVLPEPRLNEIKKFTKRGLEDFSISRLKAKMPWGIPVPGDDKHVMSVWFDALVNYISCLGWPNDLEKFNDFWPGVQVAGKDNLRQQSSMWQAMLISAGLPTSKQIFIHGFVTVGGQKMSKSLGNVIDPFELVEKYSSTDSPRVSTDTVRYFLLREIPPTEDGDFTYEKFEARYNSDLASGLGNLVARILTMVEKYCDNKVPKIDKNPDNHPLRVDKKIHNWKEAWKDLDRYLNNYQFNEALSSIWEFISEADRYIEENKPWDLAKEGKIKELNWVLYGLLDAIHQIAWQISIFIPSTALQIAKALKIEKLLVKNPNYRDSWVFIKPGTKIKKIKPLFPRI